MELRRVRPEFLHAAEHVETRLAGAHEAVEGVDRVGHRGRVGVVEIAVDRRGPDGAQFAPPLRRRPRAEARLQIRIHHPKLGGQCESERGILRHPAGNAAQNEGALAVQRDLGPLRAVENSEADGATGDLGHALVRGHEHQRIRERAERFVGPARRGKYRESARTVGGGQARFLERDAGERTEFFQVRRGDQRDDAVVGLDHLGEARHLTGPVDASLNHRDGVHCRIELRQCERDAEEVVEVALGGEDARRSAEEQSEQILGRGFAGAAGNADDGAVKFAAVFARDDLKRRERIGDDELRQLQIRIRLADERTGGAGALRFEKKIVPVALVGLQGDEDLPGPELPRVLREADERPVRQAGPTAARPGGKFFWGEGWHRKGFRRAGFF